MHQFLIVAIEAALEAGELLKSGFGSSFKISSKEGKHDLLTEYDQKSQDCILSKIRRSFPSHGILAEESGGQKQASSDEPLWIVDPLDGTANFAHCIPLFAISIAIALQGRVLAGVVYHPLGHELFTAYRGEGAYLNGRKLSVSTVKKLSEGFIATGFPFNVEKNPRNCIDTFSTIAKEGSAIRRLGAAALDLAYVAAGRFDAFWEVGLQAWDVAAGSLIVEEAGGRVSDYAGAPHPLFGYLPILASNGHLHSAFISHLAPSLHEHPEEFS